MFRFPLPFFQSALFDSPATENPTPFWAHWQSRDRLLWAQKRGEAGRSESLVFFCAPGLEDDGSFLVARREFPHGRHQLAANPYRSRVENNHQTRKITSEWARKAVQTDRFGRLFAFGGDELGANATRVFLGADRYGWLEFSTSGKTWQHFAYGQFQRQPFIWHGGVQRAPHDPRVRFQAQQLLIEQPASHWFNWICAERARQNEFGQALSWAALTDRQKGEFVNVDVWNEAESWFRWAALSCRPLWQSGARWVYPQHYVWGEQWFVSAQFSDGMRDLGWQHPLSRALRLLVELGAQSGAFEGAPLCVVDWLRSKKSNTQVRVEPTMHELLSAGEVLRDKLGAFCTPEEAEQVLTLLQSETQAP